jgi:hypothetical protein
MAMPSTCREHLALRGQPPLQRQPRRTTRTRITWPPREVSRSPVARRAIEVRRSPEAGSSAHADCAGTLAIGAPVSNGRDRHIEVLGKSLDRQQRLQAAPGGVGIHDQQVCWRLQAPPRRSMTSRTVARKGAPGRLLGRVSGRYLAVVSNLKCFQARRSTISEPEIRSGGSVLVQDIPEPCLKTSRTDVASHPGLDSRAPPASRA